MKLQKIFIDNTRPLLQEKDISYGEIARKLGISTAAVSRYYSLDRGMDIDIMVDIAEMVNKTVDELIRDEKG